MKCICGKELMGKQKYCSGACRKKASRGTVTGSVTNQSSTVTENVPSVTTSVTLDPENVTVHASVTPHPDRDNIYSRHYDTSESGFRRRNKAWDDASRFSGTPAQQEAARKANRQSIMQSCIKINQDHLSHAVSEGERRAKQEAITEAMRKIEA